MKIFDKRLLSWLLSGATIATVSSGVVACGKKYDEVKDISIDKDNDLRDVHSKIENEYYLNDDFSQVSDSATLEEKSDIISDLLGFKKDSGFGVKYKFIEFNFTKTLLTFKVKLESESETFDKIVKLNLPFIINVDLTQQQNKKWTEDIFEAFVESDKSYSHRGVCLKIKDNDGEKVLFYTAEEITIIRNDYVLSAVRFPTHSISLDKFSELIEIASKVKNSLPEYNSNSFVITASIANKLGFGNDNIDLQFAKSFVRKYLICDDDFKGEKFYGLTITEIQPKALTNGENKLLVVVEDKFGQTLDVNFDFTIKQVSKLLEEHLLLSNWNSKKIIANKFLDLFDDMMSQLVFHHAQLTDLQKSIIQKNTSKEMSTSFIVQLVNLKFLDILRESKMLHHIVLNIPEIKLLTEKVIDNLYDNYLSQYLSMFDITK